MWGIVHLESDIYDQVDMIGSAVDFEMNSCRFVNVMLVKIDWYVHWKPPGGCALDHACNEYMMSSIEKIVWLIDSVISIAQCTKFILVGASIIASYFSMNFMGWVTRTGILGELAYVLIISSKLLSWLKISASKILCSVKIVRVSISIPSMFIFDFCEEMKSLKVLRWNPHNFNGA